jgi:wyosine [tRNA(Phe)-imidazoG37] synthetase (radical SAM superfamily)
MDYLYSKNKLLKHISILDRIKKKKDVIPILARIDVTNSCNQQCVYCMYRKSLMQFGLCDSFSCKDFIKKKDLLNLILKLKFIGVKAIMFTGGGEPTIYPQFKEVVNFAVRNRLEVGIITNGARLDKSWLNLLKNNKLKWIRISLDASNQDTWNRVHRPLYGNSFNKIIKLVKFLKSSRIKTQIGASFVINDLNWKEILNFVKLCKNYNFDSSRISFAYTSKKEKLYNKYRNEIDSMLNKASKFSSEKFHVNILKERLESLESHKKNYNKCFFPFFSISIGADFRLYPCCMTKYSKKFFIADLRYNKIDKNFIQKFNKHIRDLKIKKCPICWYDNFNKSCNYYCSKKVDFENFIN